MKVLTLATAFNDGPQCGYLRTQTDVNSIRSFERANAPAVVLEQVSSDAYLPKHPSLKIAKGAFCNYGLVTQTG